MAAALSATVFYIAGVLLHLLLGAASRTGAVPPMSAHGARLPASRATRKQPQTDG